MMIGFLRLSTLNSTKAISARTSDEIGTSAVHSTNLQYYSVDDSIYRTKIEPFSNTTIYHELSGAPVDAFYEDDLFVKARLPTSPSAYIFAFFAVASSMWQAYLSRLKKSVDI
jgi:hypothetical protein